MTPGRISLKTNSTAKKSTPWLDNLLKDWKNPVFPSAEEPIPFVNPELPNLEPNGEEVSIFGDRAQSRARSHLTSSTLSVKTKLTKDALRTGKVLAQVDSQFILLLAPSDGPGASGLDMLVIVDQHAADERCRVEQLFRQLCEPATETDSITSNLGFRPSIRSTELPKPISLNLPAQEARHFRAQAGHFARWGILYDMDPSADDGASETLKVTALPTPVSRRAASDPALLAAMLRAEMWAVAEHGRGPARDGLRPGDGSGGGHGWACGMAGCPAGVVGMLNSRACRSAVMFNDPLSLRECEDLVARLARCAFPFQCAHGRPSVVPLLRLGEGLPGGGGEDGRPGFVDAFRRWREREAVEEE
jgi:DNA mismatch repair protein MLH3